MKEPKVFISYCWTSEAHKRRVEDFATQLVKNGIDVLLDVWEIKHGYDMNFFMERCVNDPTVTNVLILIDSEYTKRANGRISGVGAETSVISPEVYGQVRQEKFIPVLFDRKNGKEVVPAYLNGRFYSDLSDAETYDQHFRELVLSLYDISPHKKPPLGSIPDWVREAAGETAPEAEPEPAAEDVRTLYETIEGRSFNILVIGVGGSGEEVLKCISPHSPNDVEFVYVDLDALEMNKSPIPHKIIMDNAQSCEKINYILRDRDMVIIAANMLGHAGSTLSPVIARAAKRQGILTIGAALLPAHLSDRQDAAYRFLVSVDSFFCLKLDRPPTYIEFGLEHLLFARHALSHKTEIFLRAIKEMASTKDTIINLDFADICSVFKDGGFTSIAQGFASGKDGAEKATIEAVAGLKADSPYAQFRSAIINIEISEDCGLEDIEASANAIMENMHEDANILFGGKVDPLLKESARVTVIAVNAE